MGGERGSGEGEAEGSDRKAKRAKLSPVHPRFDKFDVDLQGQQRPLTQGAGWEPPRAADARILERLARMQQEGQVVPDLVQDMGAGYR